MQLCLLRLSGWLSLPCPDLSMLTAHGRLGLCPRQPPQRLALGWRVERTPSLPCSGVPVRLSPFGPDNALLMSSVGFGALLRPSSAFPGQGRSCLASIPHQSGLGAAPRAWWLPAFRGRRGPPPADTTPLSPQCPPSLSARRPSAQSC